jgi:tetrahydromethanopterin S-methyltransferase subunit G
METEIMTMDTREIAALLIKPIQEQLIEIRKEINAASISNNLNSVSLAEVKGALNQAKENHHSFEKRLGEMEEKIEAINEFVVQRKDREKIFTVIAGVIGGTITWLIDHAAQILHK